MPRDFLHNHPQFAELIRIVADARRIDPALVEKDYWIMHCLYGLQRLGLTFELKGGTSLSKGFRIIDRFSEDIDIRIAPPNGRDVKTGRNHTKPAHIRSRGEFYDWLAGHIRIDGITEVGVFAGWDFRQHTGTVSSSPSMQVSDGALTQALATGFAPYVNQKGETAVAFRPDFIGTYIQFLEQLHDSGTVPAEAALLSKIAEDPDEVGDA